MGHEMSGKVYSSVDDQELIEKRRKQFVTAAAELFGHKGYHATTIKEIAERAGMSTGLIYLYVKTKEDVLFLVLQSVLDSYRAEIPKALEGIEDPILRFCAAARAYCRVVGANPEATVLAYRETSSLSGPRKAMIMDMELETNQLIIKSIQDCIDAGYFRKVNVELAAYRMVLLAHGWALKAWRFKKFTTLEEYIEEGLDLFLNALMSAAGWRHYRRICPANEQ
jgi:AcrR family transcriptional regulator